MYHVAFEGSLWVEGGGPGGSGGGVGGGKSGGVVERHRQGTRDYL